MTQDMKDIYAAEIVLTLHGRDDGSYEMRVLKDHTGSIPTDTEGYLVHPEPPRVVIKPGDRWPWYGGGALL